MKNDTVRLRSHLLLLCFQILFLSSQAAQWQVVLKSIAKGVDNTLVLLSYVPLNPEAKDFGIEIAFRKKGKYNVVLSKEISIQARGQQSFQYSFKLPKGNYDVSIDILDRFQNEHNYTELPYECTVETGTTCLSDIFLSYTPFKGPQNFVDFEPTFFPVLKPDSAYLHFMMEIYSPVNRPLLARAVIYKQNIGDRTAELASKYTSEDVKNSAPIVIDGKAFYSDYFYINGLGEGEYELSIYIYDENEDYIGHKSVNFSFPGGIRQRILNDLDTSVTMMKYGTFRQSTIDSLLTISNPQEKEEAFLRCWQNLYGTRRWDGQIEETASRQMESFYQKIYLADEYLQDSGENWESDRGKIWVLYGKPTRRQSLENDNKVYERWVYLKWDLSFLFEKRNQGYVLIE